MSKLWIVRAGKQGERELPSLESNKLLPGFLEVGDLSEMDGSNKILVHLQQVLPGSRENSLRNYSRQLNQFVNRMQTGDVVVMPRKLTNGVAVGVVNSNYRYDKKSEYRHMRDVTWLKDSVPRDSFKQDLRHSFGAFMTICEVKRNSALERVKTLLKTGSDPGPSLGAIGTISGGKVNDVEDPSESDVAEFQSDIEDIANQQIVSLIKSEFAGHGLADLVSEIMQVEGYITKVSPPGPDGGVDILAVRGTLGFGEDRVCVQVKSGDGSAGHDVVLRLIGSMSNTGAENGLLVSIGGVSLAAQKELDSKFFSVRLWQLPDLLKELFRAYSALSEETRARIPLKQIWAPIAVEAE